jgi:hypothetical protein
MDRPRQVLTQKQEDFVDAFIEYDFDPVKAYQAAGYFDNTGKWSYHKALETLSKPVVVQAIKERLTKSAPSHWMSEDIIIKKLWKEATDYSGKSSQPARINALVWIGKHFGMFQEKQKQEEKAAMINIVNYSIPREQVVKAIQTPEVLEAAQKLPEGLLIQNYGEALQNENEGIACQHQQYQLPLQG